MRKTLLARALGMMFPAIQGQPPVIADNGAVPDPTSLINAILGQNPWQATVYNAAANTASFTASPSQIMGAENTVLVLTGTAGAGVALTLPTALALAQALTPQQAVVSSSIWLRVINVATTQTVTVTTNTGWTLNGTMTIATTTYRDFLVTITGITGTPGAITAATAQIQNIGGGATV